MARRRKQPAAGLSRRAAALESVPHQMPPVRTEEKEGKLYVTVRLERSKWQQLLGSARTCERTFGLDAYGRRVYESCDGKRTVQRIIRRFADKVHVSVPEAEMAVSQFMKTLLSKGLVVMEMEKPS